MSKLTRKSLHDLRDRLSGEIKIRKPSDKDAYIIVAMGEMGLERGAKEVFFSIGKKIDSLGLRGEVIVIQSQLEETNNKDPLVEVVLKGQEPVNYGGVTPEIADKIVESHIVNKQVLKKYVVTIEKKAEV